MIHSNQQIQDENERLAKPRGTAHRGALRPAAAKDLTDALNYFGSVNSDLIEADFSPEEKRVFIVKKEILFYSESAEEVSRRESEFIRENRSNDPSVGYNRWPRFKEQ